MATIPALENAGALLSYDPDFEADEFPTRWVHQAPEFVSWLANVLPHELPEGGRISTPYEQVEQRLYEYCLGRPMTYDRDRKVLAPQHHYVWEIKTPDVRLFGWLPAPRHFIAVCGEMKARLAPNAKYKPFIDRVVAFRDNLDLDLPKFLTGVSPNDIC
jgi:hypothetical protein